MRHSLESRQPIVRIPTRSEAGSAREPTRKNVVVIGAGFAGLTAAHHLERLGHRVTILETQTRVGGRALTLSDSLAAGLVPQAGPCRFPPASNRVAAFARRLGFGLTPFYPEQGAVVAYVGGTRISEYRPASGDFWGWESATNGMSSHLERTRVQLASGIKGLAFRLLGKGASKTYGIRGGTENLARALARSLAAEVRLGTTVTAIHQEHESVGVDFYTIGGMPAYLSADYVVCAVPLSVLGRLRFSPPLPARKKSLIAKIKFGSAIRVFVQMRRAYWRDHGLNGFAKTDTLGEVWAPPSAGPDTPALLVCYAQGELAKRIGALGESERIAYAVSELEKVFPGAASHFERGVSFCWSDQFWVPGGWPLARPEFAESVGEFRRPEGRVFFTGDYAATPEWLNTVEGAIESAEHAAECVQRAASGVESAGRVA